MSEFDNEHLFVDEDEKSSPSNSEFLGNTSGEYKEPQEGNSYASTEEKKADNPYGSYNSQSTNPYGTYSSNPTGNPYGAPTQNAGGDRGPSGKRIGTGFGVASMVLGIIALVLFCACINVPLAIVAIVLGIIQLVGYEKKGMAIAGIVTAVLSIVLMVGSYALLLSNQKFWNRFEEEFIEEFGDSNEFDEDDIQHFIEKYGMDGVEIPDEVETY